MGFSGKTVSYKKDGRSIVLTIGSKEAVVDGKKVTMDTPAKSIKGRTYVPLRFVSENLGIPVSWDQVGNWAWIGSKEVPDIEKSHIAKQPISKKFIDLVSTNKYLIKDKSSVRVFTIDDLPLKFGQVTVYDVWTVKINEYQAVRVRYSLGRGNIFYLGEGDRARFRSNMSHEKNSDQTVTITYQTTSQGDELREGDKNYMSFNLHKAEYIGFDRGSDSLELLQNPFRQ
ncbi:copper amine oxidase N-terminal domain-containing protein [Paenibacillus sp. JCM 10914]|uniref:copper amine oxidase N-terminal domain-containing protein n=1 Tax=Paenibacillus sp. JCM 10914 TaxID=1236974 RepID=UPI0009E04999|nr:copper amine oxidase N-terminal domain-containing protein [Paenibacillus sp. JCM 10914]